MAIQAVVTTNVVMPPQSSGTGNKSALEELGMSLDKHFYKPDLQAVRIALGALQSHRLNIGDPAWLFLVAPPGSGKTTMNIMGASDLPEVVMIGDISENTFLSGFYGHAHPGMLEKLGTVVQEGQTFTTRGDAVFLVKDFTTVLAMRREKRGAILAQLREIHDGQFKRDFGTGQTKIWKGRISIIAAVTPALDRAYGAFSVLGERFLQVRWHRPDSERAGVMAMRQQGKEEEIRDELKDLVRQVFQEADQEAPILSAASEIRIASLAEIVAIARTHVFRSAYGDRDIDYVPEHEANTRISKGLAAIAKGIAALGGHQQVTESALQDTFQVGLDCLREDRRRLLLAIVRGADVDSVALTRTMRERQLEELHELGVISKGEHGFVLSERMAHLWQTSKCKIAPMCTGGANP